MMQTQIVVPSTSAVPLHSHIYRQFPYKTMLSLSSFLALLTLATTVSPSASLSSLAPPSRSTSNKSSASILDPTKLFSKHQQAKSNNALSSLFQQSQKNIILTYLEINGWLITLNGVTILLDPILEGPLDFGIPDLYKGTKRVLPNYGILEDSCLASLVDAVVLTQGLEDHAHVQSLTKLHRALPASVPILAPPSAKGALKASGFLEGNGASVQFLKHGEDFTVAATTTKSSNDSSSPSVNIRATTGALVGPPWQTRENGYVMRASNNGPTLYTEPHVEFQADELQSLLGGTGVDVCLSPISGFGIGGYELVHGPTDTLDLLQTIRPRFLVPMRNGEIDFEGPLAKVVSPVGSSEEFQSLLQQKGTDISTQLVDALPGQDVILK